MIKRVSFGKPANVVPLPKSAYAEAPDKPCWCRAQTRHSQCQSEIRVAAIFEVGGEVVEIGANGAAPDIDQRPFFLVPTFEHKFSAVFFFIETGGAKVNQLLFIIEVPVIPIWE